MRLYLQKNDTSKNPKIPYFTLKLIPDKAEPGQDEPEWITVGALWKAKTGVGYSGFTNEGVVIDATNVKPYQKPDATAPATKPAEIEFPQD